MRLATWNVNSLPVRLPQVLEWIDRRSPDILCLQETKVPDSRFPEEPFRERGYDLLYRGQPAYNGVAILSRLPLTHPLRDFPGEPDPECRLLAATIGSLRLFNLYVPNGQDLDTPKYRYKLEWLTRLASVLEAERDRHKAMVLVGDFNIVPEDRDAYDPVALKGQIFLSPPEREALGRIMAIGFRDAFRILHPDPGHYSWWDYRQGMFRRNRGLRIDLILVTPALEPSLTLAEIDRDVRKNERPSDHAPVFVDLSDALLG
ncbi:MAG: exodeoxyribonuclease III [Leptospirillia bacterium]